MIDMSLAVLGDINASLKRMVLLLEMKELKERIHTLLEGAIVYKKHNNEEMLGEIEASTNFVEKRLAEIHLELWGGCPAELGRSATTEETNEDLDDNTGEAHSLDT